MAGAIGLAAASYLAAQVAGWEMGSEPVFDAAAILAYPLLLVGTGVLPPGHLIRLRSVVRGLLRPGSAPSDLPAALERLSAADRALLETLVRQRQPLSAVARETAAREEEVSARFAAAMRQLAGVSTDGRYDASLGFYLLLPGSVAERDAVLRRLRKQGVGAADMHGIETAFAELSRAPRELWGPEPGREGV
jgi:hypothetical protein